MTAAILYSINANSIPQFSFAGSDFLDGQGHW